jgi:hypothetical protein
VGGEQRAEGAVAADVVVVALGVLRLVVERHLRPRHRAQVRQHRVRARRLAHTSTDNITLLYSNKKQVKIFVYLESVFTTDGKCDSDKEKRVNAGNLVNGAIWVSRLVSKKAQLAVHNGVFPTLMNGSESWVWQKKHTSRLNAIEMGALRSMIAVKLSKRVRNEVIREECGVKEDVVLKLRRVYFDYFDVFRR